ncbi:transglutaminase TgpA family protein [Petrachloros mirabilis]
MPFEQAFRLSSILLAATAFAGLLFARSVPAWMAVLTTTILLLILFQVLGFPYARRITDSLSGSSTMWNVLLIGAFLLFLLDVTAISRELLPAGIHFLVILLNIRLFTLHQRSDYHHLYAISLMAILASAALTTDAWYILVFLGYLLTVVWSLLLYHLTKEAPSRPLTSVDEPAWHALSPARITGRFFWMTNGIAVITFALTLVIFFLLPRISAGLLQKSRGEGLKTTGFSERVDLGMIGAVKEDPQIVMRVELPNHPAAGKDRLYLRGAAYDRYNGRSWNTTSRRRRNLGLVTDGTFAVRSSGSRTPASLSEPLRQDILLEALDTSVLFAAPFAEYVSGEFPAVQADSMTGLHLPFPVSSRIRYSVISREHQILTDEQVTHDLDYSSSVRNQYLQLPELSHQVTELAQRVTTAAPTPYEKTVAIQQHLINGYRYSLDTGTEVSNRPIEDFLFTRKTGYCEHYATAMVLMLRTLGIPARLVTGFLATEWNDFGQYYTVRQRDAHAWVEVYYPNSGWITMDPTPSSGTAPIPSGWDMLQRVGESFRLQWDRLFIRYSARDQLAVVYSLRDSSGSARDLLHLWVTALKTLASQAAGQLSAHAQAANPLVLGLLTILLGTGVALVLIVIKRAWWDALPSHRPIIRKQQHIGQLYRKMLHVMARQGMIKHPASTPMEFLQRVRTEWSEAESIVAEFTALYCRGRFSGSVLTHEEIVLAAKQIQSLQQLNRATR